MRSRQTQQAMDEDREEKSQFYTHLSVYITMSIVMAAINLNASPEYLWFKWPLMGWGIGVAFHALNVFVLHRSWRRPGTDGGPGLR